MGLSVSYPLEVTKFWEFVAFADAGRQTYTGNLEDIDLTNTRWSVRLQNNMKLPWGITVDVTWERWSDWIWRGSIAGIGI